MWSVETGKKFLQINAHKSTVRSLVFSKNSNIIYSGSYDKTIKLFRVKNGEKIKEFRHYLYLRIF